MDNKFVKVSVIIPIYNGEKFLEKSLLMLTRQTLDDIEFVCVNDASTDGSLNILKAFKEVFPDKFVVVNSEKNRGPGGARNIGLKYARGEYIGFKDQDDYCNDDMFRMLYEKAKSGDYDIVSCGFRNKQTEEDTFPFEVEGILDDEKRLMLCKEILYIWNKIYRRKMINDMSAFFREGVSNDDTDFCMETFLRAKSAAAIGKCLYYYSFNVDSVTRSNYVDIEKQLNESKSLFDALEERIDASDSRRLYPEVLDAPLRTYAKGILKFLFYKDDFSYEDYKRYMEIFGKYKYRFEEFKKKDSNLLEEVIFNQVVENDRKSYEDIMIIKKIARMQGVIK